MNKHRFRSPMVPPDNGRSIAWRMVGWLSLLLASLIGVEGAAQEPIGPSEEQIAQDVRVVWDSGAVLSALELLDQGMGALPQSPILHKLRGDILAAFRGPQEAVREYDLALAADPVSLATRWAKWSVLVWWGQAEAAIRELRQIVQLDGDNPLVHLKLAQELRKADHLEESVESYRRAVELAPDLLDWRLALARARFDVLDYAGAEAELRSVLELAPPRSPLELSAKNQLAQLHESMDRGRRFTPVLTPGTTAAQLKEWASLRADAWRLFAAGRYREAEPLYRRLLVLNDRDPLAAYHLGITLMQLRRCEEALTVFGKVVHLDANEEHSADAMFRMGQCLVELKRWDEAFIHFQVLYNAAVEFEEANKDVALPGGMLVLSKEKLASWLERVRPHLSEEARREMESMKAARPQDADLTHEAEEEALYAKAVEQVEPQNAMGDGVSLMGRDADFSWFRFVIPAGKVVRDDFPTGAHDFIPLNAGDTFPATQSEIYLVFGLVSPSYDAVSLAARCSIELGEGRQGSDVIAQDQVMTATNDQSGYFMLTPPQGGWPLGLYRCGLFAGERANAYTLVDEARFRIVDRSQP
ncbi:MAG: tetratricopeptide repeat protein [Nitrospira sp.]|nr:tetratricopeptide repeat protein [Nitrospira sp.]MCP9442188.1 tetratricopeptide repeat protein [Nitrospira sp.]